MYPTTVQLDELCTIIRPSFPEWGEQEQVDYRYRIRDAYHLVTTGLQPPSNQDEDDVKRVMPQLAAAEVDREKAEEARKQKIDEIQNKLYLTIAKIDAALKEVVDKANAEKADARAKAEAEKAKVEAEAAAELEKLRLAASKVSPKEKAEREKAAAESSHPTPPNHAPQKKG